MSFWDGISEFLNGDIFGYLLHAAEVAVAILIFGVVFQKRKKFVLRIVLTLVLFLAASTALGLLLGKYLPYFRYFISFVLSLGILPVCFKANYWDELFCTITAVVIQNLSYSLACIVAAACGWDPVEITLYSALVEAVLYVAVHLVCFRICLPKLKTDKGGFGVERISLIILAFVMLLVVYILQYDKQSLEAYEYFSWRIMFIVFDLLVLFMFFAMYDKGQLKKENEILDNMQRSAATQYEMDQRSIELINIKCHDLKNQLESIRDLSIEEKDSAISDAENAVMIYESIAKTGNKSLDVLLSNKCLVCEKSGIRLTYVVDGDALDFMNPVDIFSLFGNALDNAIRAVADIEDEHKRVIRMECRRRGQFLFISFENYCEKNVRFRNGLPVTSQEDTNVHGYGMLSMRRTAESYGGVMDVQFRDSIFSLSITVPIPSDKAAGPDRPPETGRARPAA
ncbi:MAG: ATP-binding protein [Clostridia bacterium]|nr:ATP-binding protein [Clostridia bacterium]